MVTLGVDKILVTGMMTAFVAPWIGVFDDKLGSPRGCPPSSGLEDTDNGYLFRPRSEQRKEREEKGISHLVEV